ALSPRCEELAATRPDFGEIGRVVTAPGPGRLDAVTRLFAAMVKHFLDTGEATGVTGVCRRRVVRFYARFGMAAIHDDPLGILGRDHDDYFVVAGSFEHMVSKGMYRLLEGPGSTRVLPGRDPTSVR
ncbi:MAG: hypothetical protein GX596_09935, partial [Propionibacterium sp.]|nr:hypothetical protein [Propionibacterium sp.]